jgi:hypothetical protein
MPSEIINHLALLLLYTITTYSSINTTTPRGGMYIASDR